MFLRSGPPAILPRTHLSNSSTVSVRVHQPLVHCASSATRIFRLYVRRLPIADSERLEGQHRRRGRSQQPHLSQVKQTNDKLTAPTTTLTISTTTAMKRQLTTPVAMILEIKQSLISASKIGLLGVHPKRKGQSKYQVPSSTQRRPLHQNATFRMADTASIQQRHCRRQRRYP